MANGRKSIYDAMYAPSPFEELISNLPQQLMQVQQANFQRRQYEDRVKQQKFQNMMSIGGNLKGYQRAQFLKAMISDFPEYSSSISALEESENRKNQIMADVQSKFEKLDTKDLPWYEAKPILEELESEEYTQSGWMQNPIFASKYDRLSRAFEEQENTGYFPIYDSGDRDRIANLQSQHTAAINSLTDNTQKLAINEGIMRNLESDIASLIEGGASPTSIKVMEKKKELNEITNKFNEFRISQPVKQQRTVATLDKLNAARSKYKVPMQKLPGEETPDTGTGDRTVTPKDELIASGAGAITVEEADKINAKTDAMIVLTTATPGTDEYEKAKEDLAATTGFRQLTETDIGTPRPPSGIFEGARERLSVAGQEREDTGEKGIGIRPGAKAFKLPPEQAVTPEYFERVTSQAEEAISETGAEKRATVGGMQNPKNTQQYYGGDINVAIASENKKLIERDNIVKDAKLALSVIPKSAKFQKEIKRLQKLIKDNPIGQRWIRSGGKTRLIQQKGSTEKIDQRDSTILANYQSGNSEKPENNLNFMNQILGTGIGGGILGSQLPPMEP